MITDIRYLILSYCTIPEIYSIFEEHLPRTHNIINFQNLNADNITLEDPKHIHLIMDGLYNTTGFNYDLSCVAYKGKPLYIKSPKLYTETGIQISSHQYSLYRNMLALETKLNKDSGFIIFLDLLHKKLFDLSVPNLKKYNEFLCPDNMLSQLFYRIYVPDRDNVTKQIISTDMVILSLDLDQTIFFDLDGKIYERDELADYRFWYTPIFEVKAVCFYNSWTEIIIGLKYAVVLKNKSN